MEISRLGRNKGVEIMIRRIGKEEIDTIVTENTEVLVIVDTSLLMAVGSGRPSFESLLEVIEGKPILIIPKTVVNELEKHYNNSRFSVSSKASLALAILEKTQVSVYALNSSYSSNADDDIYLLASNLKNSGFNLIVATVDRELRQRIKAKGIPVVYLRRTENRFELS